MWLGAVWGEEASSENTARCLEDFNLKTACQANKAEAVILFSIMTVYMSSIGTDLICVCTVRLWSSCSRPPLYSTAEYNIKHCLGSVWNLSRSIHYRCLKKGVSRFVSTLSEVCERIIGGRSHRWKYRYVCAFEWLPLVLGGFLYLSFYMTASEFVKHIYLLP